MAMIENAHWVGGSRFHKLKKWKNGIECKGPAGNRKTKTRNLMAKLAIKQVHSIVVFCSDQHGQRGTGFVGDYKRNK